MAASTPSPSQRKCKPTFLLCSLRLPVKATMLYVVMQTSSCPPSGSGSRMLEVNRVNWWS